MEFDPVTPKLWQGSRPEKGGEAARAGAHVLVLTAAEYQPEARYFPGVRVLHCPLHDRPYQSDRDIAKAMATAKKVAHLLRSGATVLSTCHMGWNRSGLISALALVDLGYDSDTAIRLVRNARGPSALSNRTFEILVRTQGKPRVSGRRR